MDQQLVRLGSLAADRVKAWSSLVLFAELGTLKFAVEEKRIPKPRSSLVRGGITSLPNRFPIRQKVSLL